MDALEHALISPDYAARRYVADRLNERLDGALTVDRADLEYIDGEWTIDGMEPFEWADDMAMD